MKRKILLPLGIPHKKLKKIRKFSSTKGITKPKCKASANLKRTAKRNRSYKEKCYQTIINIWNKRLEK